MQVEVISGARGLPKRSGAMIKKNFRGKKEESMADVYRITKMPDI